MFARPLAAASILTALSLPACGPSVAVDSLASGGEATIGTTTSTGSTTTGTTTSTDTTTTSTTTTTTTTKPPLTDPGVRIAQGAKPWCLKNADGTVTCHDYYAGAPGQALPFELPGITDAAAVVQSLEFGCVLHATGAVSCWGYSHKGQLGLALPYDQASPVPLLLPEVTLVKISAGHHSACGIEPSGQAVCWGGNYDGPLGNPSVSQTQAPVPVVGIPDAIDIGNMFVQACAVRKDGSVHCWEGNEAPHPIEGISGASQISVGWPRTCAIVGGGKVLCWDEGQQILPVAGIDDAVQISVVWDYACARRAGGLVSCWWGIPMTGEELFTLPIEDAVDMSAVDHIEGACAVRSSGQVSCWDKNGVESPFGG